MDSLFKKKNNWDEILTNEDIVTLPILELRYKGNVPQSCCVNWDALFYQKLTYICKFCSSVEWILFPDHIFL